MLSDAHIAYSAAGSRSRSENRVMVVVGQLCQQRADSLSRCFTSCRQVRFDLLKGELLRPLSGITA